MTDLTAVSLFAGIGGFDLAMERAGVKVAAAVEIDPACRGVLRRHFPQAKIFSDVKEVTGEQLRAAGFVPGRGVLCFGWPCQGNSVAGGRKGMADPRSGLWRHVVRLVAETRPRWLLGENVPGLLSVNGGRDFGAVIRDLDELGYGVAWRVLDAQFFGVPQRRRRVFLAGCLGDPCGPVEVLLEPEGGEGNPAAGGEAGAGAAGPPQRGIGGAGIVGALTRGSLTDYDDNTAQAGQFVTHAITAREAKEADSDATSGFIVASTLQGGGRRGHRVDAEGAAGGHLIAATLTAGIATSDGVRPPGRRAEDDVNLIAHALTSEGADASEDGTGRGTPLVTVPGAASLTAGNATGEGVRPSGRRQEDDVNLAAAGTAVRRLTPRECERLQGFPVDWTRWLDDGTEQSDSARYRQCGNAIAVPVAEWIARRVVAAELAAEAESAA